MALFEPFLVERLVLLSAVLLRLLVGLSSYSGQGVPPKYGDFEAQRHWMEIALNLPARQWYQDSDFNDGQYWPLDYPPLSGWQSLIHGWFIHSTEPSALTLVMSHGYESEKLKQMMRYTVLVSDLLIYFPAAYLCVRSLHGGTPSLRRAFALAVVLLNPALVIIDHGHFQYNCISLGLTTAAVAAILHNAHLPAAALFTAAMLHKHMSLYFAPAFFAHMLGRALQRVSVADKVKQVALLGATVIGTTLLISLPWVMEPGLLPQVLRRIFPVGRGLWEDYVSNFWCTTSVAIKWKQMFGNDVLLPLCMLATILGCLPSMVHQIRMPTNKGLLLCMANCAFSFYMFGFQVHEKSILLPLLPITLMAGSEALLVLWAVVLALLSMFPLLERDGLSVPYAGLWVIWAGLMWPWGMLVRSRTYGDGDGLAVAHEGRASNNFIGSNGERAGASSSRFFKPDAAARRKGSGEVPDRAVGAASKADGGAGDSGEGVSGVGWGAAIAVSVASALHWARNVIPPPERLPWLWDRAFITVSFAGLVVCVLYLQVKQWGAGTSAAVGMASSGAHKKRS